MKDKRIIAALGIIIAAMSVITGFIYNAPAVICLLMAVLGILLIFAGFL